MVSVNLTITLDPPLAKVPKAAGFRVVTFFALRSAFQRSLSYQSKFDPNHRIELLKLRAGCHLSP